MTNHLTGGPPVSSTQLEAPPTERSARDVSLRRQPETSKPSPQAETRVAACQTCATNGISGAKNSLMHVVDGIHLRLVTGVQSRGTMITAKTVPLQRCSQAGGAPPGELCVTDRVTQ